MRAVLLSRLSSRPALLSRVTVLPCDALNASLEEPAEAVVMINVSHPRRRGRGTPGLAARLTSRGQHFA
jgi:hypothetical protein